MQRTDSPRPRAKEAALEKGTEKGGMEQGEQEVLFQVFTVFQTC